MIAWGVAITRISGETLATNHLRQAGYSVLCPRVQLQNGRTVSLFYRYIFVQFDFRDPHQWHGVRYSPAVVRILGDDDPHFLPHRFVRSVSGWGEEVIEVGQLETRGVLMELFQGEEVVIVDGHLAGRSGRVVWSSLAAVNLEIFDGPEVTVPRCSVEATTEDSPLDRREDYLRRRIARFLANPQDDAQPDRRLGCTIRGLVSYVGAQFHDGMTWENWGRCWRLAQRRFFPHARNDQNYHYSNLVPVLVDFDVRWAAHLRAAALLSSQRLSQR